MSPQNPTRPARRFIRWAQWLLLAAVWLLYSATATACPYCQSVHAHNNDPQQSAPSGYGYSIVFMMAVPLAVATVLGGAAWWSRRSRTETGRRSR